MAPELSLISRQVLRHSKHEDLKLEEGLVGEMNRSFTHDNDDWQVRPVHVMCSHQSHSCTNGGLHDMENARTADSPN